jgi:hypothetical protein
MASGWTTATASAIQDDQFGVSTRTAPTTPMKLSVETVAGSAASAGTELGSTTRPTVTMGAASGAPPVSSNSASCTVVAGAAGTVVAAAIWDSAGTPIRKAFGPLGTSRTVAIGDSLAFAIGAITFTTTSP